MTVNPDDRGPMTEYDDRVAQGRLRDDEHQRGGESFQHIANGD
jgi:protein AFG1